MEVVGFLTAYLITAIKFPTLLLLAAAAAHLIQTEHQQQAAAEALADFYLQHQRCKRGQYIV